MPRTHTAVGDNRGYDSMYRARNKAYIGALAPDYTFRYVENCDIILVGEKHSGEGARRISDAFQDMATFLSGVGAVAIEMPPGTRATSSGAMGDAADCAQYHDVPLYAIDERRTAMHQAQREAPNPGEPLLSVANTFTHPIQEDGSLNRKAAENARQAVYELFGENVYDEMYTNREIGMASRLRWLNDHHDGCIVAVVGAFHLDALEERIEDGFMEQPMSADRVLQE